MPNPATIMARDHSTVGASEQRLVVDGYVSSTHPAPATFTAPLYVVVPEHSTTVPLGPCDWGAIHGTTLPAQGAACVVVFDEREVPVVVWWEGAQSERGIVTLAGTPGKATVTAPTVTTGSGIQLTVLGTPVAVAVKERKAGSFVIEAAAASTAEVAWLIQ